MLSAFEQQLCDIQGRLFELSLSKGLDSADFIDRFMCSSTCAFFDLPFNRLQWAGEEYILEELMEEVPVAKAGTWFGREELYWIGYTYRAWHFLKAVCSEEIHSVAPAALMRDCYPGFHTLDVAMAVENLLEIAEGSM
jgi:hypothetical protein